MPKDAKGHGSNSKGSGDKALDRERAAVKKAAGGFGFAQAMRDHDTAKRVERSVAKGMKAGTVKKPSAAEAKADRAYMRAKNRAKRG